MRIAATILILTVVLSAVASLPAAEAKSGEWKAGIAVQVITPDQSMWMAGYGARNKPSEGKLTELYVKALALEDPHGGRLVLLTSDLVGIPRSLSEPVAAEVRKRKGLPRERLMFTVSHTHCGPVLNDSLRTMYDMPPDEAKKIEPYTAKVKGWMIDVIVRALDDLKPARLSYGKSTARFAVNRRKPTDKDFINDANPAGPVDHDLPIPRPRSARGERIAVHRPLSSGGCGPCSQIVEWRKDVTSLAPHFPCGHFEEDYCDVQELFMLCSDISARICVLRSGGGGTAKGRRSAAAGSRVAARLDAASARRQRHLAGFFTRQHQARLVEQCVVRQQISVYLGCPKWPAPAAH